MSGETLWLGIHTVQYGYLLFSAEFPEQINWVFYSIKAFLFGESTGTFQPFAPYVWKALGEGVMLELGKAY